MSLTTPVISEEHARTRRAVAQFLKEKPIPSQIFSFSPFCRPLALKFNLLCSFGADTYDQTKT